MIVPVQRVEAHARKCRAAGMEQHGRIPSRPLAASSGDASAKPNCGVWRDLTRAALRCQGI